MKIEFKSTQYAPESIKCFINTKEYVPKKTTINNLVGYSVDVNQTKKQLTQKIRKHLNKSFVLGFVTVFKEYPTNSKVISCNGVLNAGYYYNVSDIVSVINNDYSKNKLSHPMYKLQFKHSDRKYNYPNYLLK